MPEDLLKVFLPAVAAFWIGIAFAPVLTHYLYKFKVWKKHGGKIALDGTAAKVFTGLRAETETKTPRMGGILIWSSVILTTAAAWALAHILPSDFSVKLDFFSRSQTWIPLTTLVLGALVGFVNDILDVTDPKGEKGIPISGRLLFVALLSLFIGWWFYDKLDVVSISMPFGPDLYIGWLVIPLFMLVSIFLYASGVIDGIDGLSGGVFASIFFAYAFIAFHQSQFNLAAFCATVVGALLAFLWFNIPPARFWMTETGSMGLTITIAAVAFLTDTLGDGKGLSALPVIAFLLVATVFSNVIQVVSKKLRGGKKIFRIAPLHHHFEAIGWPGYKVTMRYWILSIVFAIAGVSIALLR
jgi:phospho-N-acetylmuramoyl-pentapeptide-transferase